MNGYDDGPIVACSTGLAQNTAIALIRLSGLDELGSLGKFFSPLPQRPREATTCHILDGKKVLDQVVLTFFAAPHSYTGENLLELSVHGNLVNVQRILDLFTSSGTFRLAAPGEFTYRALKNDKITLSEVEGLDLFLNAPSKGVLDQASKLMGGELTRAYLGLRESFLALKACLELSLDFLQDVGEQAAKQNFDRALADFSHRLQALYHRTRSSLQSIIVPDIVLVGRPNVGKSSLFNRFLHHSRSIVSAEEGTTRDYVSEYISLKDIQFRLIDTAGVREALGGVEREGITRSIELIERAFFKILLINPDTFNLEELAPLKDIPFDLLLLTHADMTSQRQDIPLNYRNYGYISLKSGSIEPGEVEIKSGSIEPSGPIGPKGLTTLEKLITSKYLKLLENDEILIPRQRALIQQSAQKLDAFQKLVASESDIAVISSELNLIGQLVEELIGSVCVDEVLEQVFSRFCIGK